MKYLKLSLFIISLSISAALTGRLLAAVNEWQAPGISNFPPAISNVQLILGNGADALGNHMATKKLNLNGHRIYGTGTTDKPVALDITSTVDGIGLDVESTSNHGITVQSSHATSSALEISNQGSGYALTASSTRGLAARFGGLLAITSSTISEIPALQWRQSGSTFYNRLTTTPSGSLELPDLSLYWGSQLVCDATKVNCGRIANTSGDNLGSHQAIYDLNMASHSILNINNEVRRNFSLVTHATSSLTINHPGSGVGIAAVSGSYGITATTDLDMGSSRVSHFFQNGYGGNNFSSSAIYHGRAYWGTVNTGFLDDIVISHGGIYPESDWRSSTIKSLCSNLDLNVTDMASYGEYLYMILKSDVSVPGHPIYRLLRYDDKASGTNCYTYSALPKDASVKTEDFNGLSALTVYRNKLYGVSTSNGLAAAERCQLLSFDGSQWKREARLPNSNCGPAMRLLASGKTLYIQHDDALNVKVYTYDGTQVTNISPGSFVLPSVRISGTPIPSGWVVNKQGNLMIGDGSGKIYTYKNGNWTLELPQLVVLTQGDGASDVMYYEDTLYVNDIQGGGTSIGYYYNESNSTWVNTTVGYRSQTFRGTLFLPSGGNVQLGLPSAAMGYSSGSGYGIYGASVLGPGARLYGGIQLLNDTDVNIPAQLTLGNDSNSLSTIRATSTADNNLYWGNRLLCLASDSNCGYTTSVSSDTWFVNGQGDIYTHKLVNIGQPNAGQTPSSHKLATNFTIDQNYQLRNTMTLPGDAYGSSALEGTRMYVLTNNLVAVYDISNPSNLNFLGVVDPAEDIVRGSDIEVRQQIAYISVPGLGLMVLDVAHPGAANPSYYVAESSEIQNPSTIALGQSLAYVGSKQTAVNLKNVQIFDIVSPYDATLRYSFATGGAVNDIEIRGSYAFFAHDPGGMQIWDVSNPSAPIQVSSISHPLYSNVYGSRIIVNKNDAYIYFSESVSTGFHYDLIRYDISTISSPTFKQKYFIDSTQSPGVSDMKLIDDTYLIASHVLGFPHVTVYNVDRDFAGAGYPAVIDTPNPAISSIEIIGNQILFVGADSGTPGIAEQIYSFTIPGVRLQNVVSGQTQVTRLRANSLTGNNLYTQSGLTVGSNLTISQGPLVSVKGKLKLGGRQILDETLLNQLLQWLNT